MEEKLLELTGTVEQVIFRNEKNGYTILDFVSDDELVVAVGNMPFVSPGEELRVIGKWVTHPTFGDQFKVDAFEREKPTTAAAMLKYLSSGAVKGIRKATAARIVEAFGEHTLDVLENEPERLASVKGITVEKAKNIGEEFQKIYGIRELMLHLGKYGITPEETLRVWKAYGTEAINMVENNPFCLCQDGLEIDFMRADYIAESFLYPQDDGCRIKAGILHVLQHNMNNGHTCLPNVKLVAASAQMLRVEKETIAHCLQSMLDDQIVLSECFGSGEQQREYIFTPALHRSEAYAASRLTMLLQFPPQSIVGVEDQIRDIEKYFQIQYAEQQRKAIRDALEKGILILTGGPGTGKTTTLNAIITILEENGERVLLAAPTGRAAKRMTELTGHESKTIHRLLQVEWNDHDNPVFSKNEKNLLECDALILDELSMLDVQLFEKVLRAMPLGCRLIMVGDCDQLPSVGPGNVLGHLISTEMIPVVQLNEIFRQSMQSLIVTNAHRIVDGEMPELHIKDRDFFFLPCYDAKNISSILIDLCARRLPDRYGYGIWNEIQVLSPSRKGELGTVELNRKLQEAINPKEDGKREIQVNGIILREQDKVMQMKNNYNLPWTKTDGTTGEGVFNGDIGILLDIDRAAGFMTVQMEDRLVEYDIENAGELELAYAITVHKSQGSEFPAVVMPMFPGPSQLYYRNLLYTAITRAKSLLILVGREKTIQVMVENDRKTKRYSGLYYFLKENRNYEV